MNISTVQAKEAVRSKAINLDAPLLQPLSRQEERDIADRVRRAWQKKAERHLASLNRNRGGRCGSLAELESMLH